MTPAVHINRDRLWTSLEAGFSTEKKAPGSAPTCSALP